ncbi:MAG: nucleotidyltransferase family protein [Bacteroidetes bacterium]|nr:nucleotidyltransferase family protein [Bacteroidota bacterium]
MKRKMMISGLRKEDRLILHLCRTVVGPEVKDELMLLISGQPDWEYIARCVRQNGVEALFYMNILPFKPPPEIHERLRQAYYLNLKRNILLEEEISRVVRVLDALRIQVVILKGMSLARFAYGDLSLRQMADIDLLVHPKDLVKAYEHLQQSGYQPIKVPHSRWHVENMIRLGKHLPDLWNGTNSLDLHAKLLTGEETDSPFHQEIWDHLDQAVFKEATALVLSPALQLVYTAVHLNDHAGHGLFQLRLYCDLAEVARNQMKPADWGLFSDLLSRFSLSEAVLPHLYLASFFLGSPVPCEVIPDGVIENPETLKQWFIDNLATGKKAPADTVIRDEFMKTFRKLKGMNAKFRHTLGYVFPSKKFMLQRYSIPRPGFYYLWYFHRLARIFRLLLDR